LLLNSSSSGVHTLDATSLAMIRFYA
jgi:hypothetical protein